MTTQSDAELQDVRDTARALVKAKLEFRLAVCAAIDSGASFRAVAAAAGHKATSQVQKIVRDR